MCEGKCVAPVAIVKKIPELIANAIVRGNDSGITKRPIER
jgi:hypothetical protein